MDSPASGRGPAFNSPYHLSPAYRGRALDRLAAEHFDVVIIGGGVVGAGTALDAAARGLHVALIEQRDLAAGTSSRSSKLIHGGLRYLEQFDFGLVREALRERTLLVEKLAPHLVRPVRFLYPLRHRIWERIYVGAGIALYDLLALFSGSRLPRHRHLGRRRALREAPALRKSALVGAVQYSDAQVDDARHTLAVARTSAAYGAVIVTSVRATGVLREASNVTGVAAECLETGAEFTIRGRHVVNATGVWTDHTEGFAGDASIEVTASKGIHLVVPRDRIESSTGMIIRAGASVLFIIPWGDHWLIGTTDTKWDLDLSHPAASASDIRYLLEHINGVLKDPLTTDDIEGVYAGLRPLLTGESEATSKLSREHAVWTTAPGMTSVAGGKYTTYRVMAKDTVDFVGAQLDEKLDDSPTADIPLIGADGFETLWQRRQELAEQHNLTLGEVEPLLRRHGTLVEEVLSIVSDRPELGEPLPGSRGYLLAEAVYAVRAEGALHLDDVLTRRTRISIESRDRGLSAAAAIAPLMAEELGWDEATVDRELIHYRARVDAERDSQTKPDDRTADAARLGAPDVRRMGLG